MRPTRSRLASLLPALLLAGCPKAVTRVDDQLTGRVCFSVEPGWDLKQNYRWFGTQHIALAPDPPSRSLTVDLRRIRGEGEDLPLDLVAEGVVGEFGRSMGIVTEATDEREIVLAGYRAVALTGTRRHGPRQMDFTAWVARPPGSLLVVQLLTPPGELQREVLLLQRVLESFRLPLDPPPPDTLEGD